MKGSKKIKREKIVKIKVLKREKIQMFPLGKGREKILLILLIKRKGKILQILIIIKDQEKILKIILRLIRIKC